MLLFFPIFPCAYITLPFPFSFNAENPNPDEKTTKTSKPTQQLPFLLNVQLNDRSISFFVPIYDNDFICQALEPTLIHASRASLLAIYANNPKNPKGANFFETFQKRRGK